MIALDNYYEQISSLINYSEGRYLLSDILQMIPWEFKVYLFKFGEYIDRRNE